MGKGSTEAERYEELGIADALSRPADYRTGSHELSSILRLAYSNLPKNLQSLVFRDTLLAFRTLPSVRTGSAISSANILLQSAESALPKQKKLTAVLEFKHSVVAHKRFSNKSHQDIVLVQLPHDVLVHVFSFLDTQSLVAASSVCWSWNSAATDNTLWRVHYSLYFGPHLNKNSDMLTNFDWREAFQTKYTGDLSVRLASNRAFCTNCGLMIWLSNLTCASKHFCCKLGKSEAMKIRSILPNKVVDYILGESELTEFSSDSEDSDSDESPFRAYRLPKLWAYPGLASGS